MEKLSFFYFSISNKKSYHRYSGETREKLFNCKLWNFDVDGIKLALKFLGEKI